MARIKNMTDLRNSALSMLEKVESGSMALDVAQALVSGYVTIMATTKLEMEYQKLLGTTNEIAFLETNNVYELDHKEIKSIGHDE